MSTENTATSSRNPRTFDEILDILPQFTAAYVEKRPPVLSAGLGDEITKRGSRRLVFNAFLKSEPTDQQQRNLKKTFRGSTY